MVLILFSSEKRLFIILRPFFQTNINNKSTSNQNNHTNPQLNTQLSTSDNASSDHSLYPGNTSYDSICTNLSHPNGTNIKNTNSSSENDNNTNTSLSLLSNSFNQSHSDQLVEYDSNQNLQHLLQEAQQIYDNQISYRGHWTSIIISKCRICHVFE